MALSALAATVANIKRRAGQAWVSDDAGTTWYNLGVIKQPKINIEEIVDEADTRGRSKQLGVNLSIELVMKQTSNTELGELNTLTNQELLFAITGDMVSPATSTQSYKFDKSLLNISGAIDFSGGESMFTVKVNGQLSMPELTVLATTGACTWGE